MPAIKTQHIPGSLAVSFLQSLFDVVRKCGITEKEILNAAGLQLNLSEGSHQRISGNQYCHLLEVAAEQCEDKNFGLHMGEAIKPGYYGVLGYACMSSATFEETFQRINRYQLLVSDIGLNTVQLQDEKVKFQFDCKTFPYPPRHLAEEHLVGIVVFSRWIRSKTSSPYEVHFQHPRPSDTSEHEHIFSCPVLFDQPETAIYFPVEVLTEPLTQADPVVSKMMDGYAEQQLIKLPKGEDIIDQARVALATLLQSGEPGLEKLAHHLELNPRSLQRRLKEEDLSYQNLLEKTRHQLALTYMQQSNLSLTDIAFLLGFSEQSSFQRAFKRWTDETPGRYRKNYL